MRARVAGLWVWSIASSGLFAASCTSSESTGPAAIDAGASDGSIGGQWLIGVSDSLSGDLSSIGVPLQNAVRVAETYINGNGGVLGKQVKFIIKDDQTNKAPTEAIGDLVNQGVVAIIGPNASGQVLAVHDALLRPQKILEISATATSSLLTTAYSDVQNPRDRYLFRTVPSDAFQGRAVVKFALTGPKSFGGADGGAAADAGTGQGIDASVFAGDGGGAASACPKMALLYMNDAYGMALAQVIRDAYSAAGGGTIVSDLQVADTKATSYSDEITQLKAANPDCLAMVLYDAVADEFLTELDQQILSPPPNWNPGFFMIGTDGLQVQAFIDNGRIVKTDPTSPSAAEGVYGTTPITAPNTQEFADFKNLYTTQFPLRDGETDLPPYVANEFDAAMLVALAIAQAGGTSDRARLRDALFDVSSGSKDSTSRGPADFAAALTDIQSHVKISYRGASGPVNFDDNGDVKAGYLVWRVRNGKFETIGKYSFEDL